MTNAEKVMRFDETIDFLKMYKAGETVMASFLLRMMQETEEERNEKANRNYEIYRASKKTDVDL